MFKREDSFLLRKKHLERAHAFFENDEPKVVNGVLDQLARQELLARAPKRRFHPYETTAPGQGPFAPREPGAPTLNPAPVRGQG